MITTKTPFRISFFGGGTDHPAWFKENGGKVLGNISNKLNILVTGDSKPTKSKIEKARDAGVKIISEADWYKFLNI